MSSVQHLREFISERLTAAAEEIFTEFEKTIVQYEEEIDRQRRLLDITWNPQIKLLRTDVPQQHVHKEEVLHVLADQQLFNQERNSSLDQEEFPGMKEEQEELCSRSEAELLVLKQEMDNFISASTFQENDFTEGEPNTDQLSSLNFPFPGIQDQEGNKQTDSTRGTMKPKRRHPSPSDDEDDAPGSESPFDSKTSEKVSSRTLLPHTRTQKGGKFHPCEMCGKKFPKKYLETHIRKHTGERPFLCPVCGKSFSTKSYLKVHMRIHTGEKLHSCERCGKGFISKSNMSTHMRIHTGTKPFSCKICGKRFTQNGSLSLHMRIHTGEKLHSCERCGKGFISKSNMSTHMRIHTGTKPFSCKVCGKRFTQNGSLSLHMRIHTDQRP
ncbi:zinc finger protein 484-like [Melanotaenia boesemani]|uniref:zinc finger protein 484-like n=1 Tax=Melanotaenia boesemani TaxID=1250792 RepID=UPI001C05D293|nr:zinc finger protein 484-like [Melanotaenia boesemani]